MIQIRITERKIFYAMIISGVIYIFSQLAIMSILSPIGSDSVISFQLTFNRESMAALLNSWGDGGIETFKKHFYLDFFHPLWYGAFLFFTMLFVKTKLSRYQDSTAVPKYVYLPFVAAFFDCAENFLEIEIIDRRFNLTDTLVIAAGLTSLLKWLIALASILIIIALAVQLALRASRARGK